MNWAVEDRVKSGSESKPYVLRFYFEACNLPTSSLGANYFYKSRFKCLQNLNR
jgi:hypothetical protein